MDAQYISYQDTNAFSEPLNRYINHDHLLADFINKPPTKAGFDAFLKEKELFKHREVLNLVLTEQYQHIKEAGQLSEKTAKNLSSLLNEQTFTITTGHQLNIFTGPLYFIFKIVSAIKLADDLNKTHPDKHFVPVYWMATEDHDFEEINHTYIGNKRILWSQNQQGATGKINTESIRTALKEYLSVLGISEKAAEFSGIIEDAYRHTNNLAQATRTMVNRLFAAYGLIVIDADDRRLKALFKPIIIKDIFEQNSFSRINEQIQLLQKIQIESQVTPREINFFYLDDHLRERIVKEDDVFKVLNTPIIFTKEELLQEINDFPEKFSPNVVMRPLYQEVILPNIAYVGGGAEIIYWLQLKSTFDFYKTQFPILIPRNSALIIKAVTSQKLQHLGLTYHDLFLDINELQKKWVRQHTIHELSIETENRELDAVFEKIKSKAAEIDLSLAPSTEAVKVRLNHALKNLEKKLLKAEKRKNFESMEKIRKIKHTYFPMNGLQERSENFGLFYINNQYDFLQELYQKFEPLDFKFTILIEK